MLRKTQSSPVLVLGGNHAAHKLMLPSSSSAPNLNQLTRTSVVSTALPTSGSGSGRDPQEPNDSHHLDKIMMLSSLPDSILAKHSRDKLVEPTSLVSLVGTTVETPLHQNVNLSVTQFRNERCEAGNLAIKVAKNAPISPSLNISVVLASPGETSLLQTFELAGGVCIGPSLDMSVTIKAGLGISTQALSPFVSAELSTPSQNAGIRLDFNQLLQPIQTTLTTTQKTAVSAPTGSHQVEKLVFAVDPVLVINEAKRILQGDQQAP